ncbi:MAG: serine/threonine protein kinase [Sandaracinaceae bacterium]|nr:serine/threonine protein kinase [Sandaracinaceae bacterium]
MTSAAPTRLHRGRFELRRELGQGGTGTVFAAWDGLRERAVALKQLNHVDPQSLYLLKNEFRSAAELTHENLVRLGELFAEGGAVFFTMELLEGVDFLSYVRSTDLDSQRDVPTQVRPRREEDPSPRSSAPPPPDALVFDEAALRASLRQLFTGLHALHALGLVHRDVEPSNALVERGGRLVLLDFGLTAEVRAHREGEHGWIVGTPRYMAPEQVRNAAVGPAADSYAAGVMLHEALVGRPRSTAARARSCSASSSRRSAISPSASPSCRPISGRSARSSCGSIRPAVRATRRSSAGSARPSRSW